MTRAELLALAEAAVEAQHAATVAANAFFQAFIDLGNFRKVDSDHVFVDPDVVESIAEIRGAALDAASPMEGALKVAFLIARSGGPNADRIAAAIESGGRRAEERCPCAGCTERRTAAAAELARAVERSTVAARSPQ